VPTTDPFAYPYAGSLVPFADHKGYGLAVLIETLSGMVPGAGTLREVLSWIDHDPSLPTRHGAAFMAIDVGAMIPIDAFKARMDRMIREIRQAPKAKGSDRIYLPGEREWENRREALAGGIAMPEDVLESLRGLAQDLGMRVDWLSAG